MKTVSLEISAIPQVEITMTYLSRELKFAFSSGVIVTTFFFFFILLLQKGVARYAKRRHISGSRWSPPKIWQQLEMCLHLQAKVWMVSMNTLWPESRFSEFR